MRETFSVNHLSFRVNCLLICVNREACRVNRFAFWAKRVAFRAKHVNRFEQSMQELCETFIRFRLELSENLNVSKWLPCFTLLQTVCDWQNSLGGILMKKKNLEEIIYLSFFKIELIFNKIKVHVLKED